jgi:acetate kinase
MPQPAQPASPLILTINGGSSSIKFAVFSLALAPERLFSGQVERIGSANSRLTATTENASQPEVKAVAAATFEQGAGTVLDYLQERVREGVIGAVGHRIVHGGVHLANHQIITEDLIAELHRTEPLDLAHLPREISLIEGLRKAFPKIPQVACFDTAFHHDMPRVAQLLPIPRRYLDKGVRRFGFHGLSYTYLMSQLTAVAGAEAAGGRVILAHLGSGASMAAVRAGKSIDTTMAFTPTAGLVMGTRPGDIDPGLLVYLMKEENLSYADMDKFISRDCGLAGVSATSSDMRDLLAARAKDARAGDAVDLFCYQARKHLCALASTLGGLDMVVFAGGIGEHAPEVRQGICAGLEFLGVKLDADRNERGEDVISAAEGRVAVRVIATDEEIVIARIVRSLV